MVEIVERKRGACSSLHSSHLFRLRSQGMEALFGVRSHAGCGLGGGSGG